MSAVLVSAPGKVIITGEHAVVYGHPAVVAPLQRRTYVHIQPSSNVQLIVPQISVNESWILQELTGIDENSVDTSRESVRAFLYLYSRLGKKYGLRGMIVTIKTELFIGAGLGSSASYAVSLSAGLMKFFGEIDRVKDSLHLINKNAFDLERLFHGRPSGADNTTCCYGNIRCYDNSGNGCHDNRRIVEGLKIEACIVNTFVARNTKTLVGMVREQYDKYRAVVSPILDSIGEISKQTFQVLNGPRDRIYSDIYPLIEYNHKLLHTLSLSHGKIEEIRSVVGRFGLCCKLTGAGGGGCVLILLSPDVDESMMNDLYRELAAVNVGYFTCQLGGDGVREEDISVWNQDTS